MVSAIQDRLLMPPRVEHFCPGQHCARSCGPTDCTCKPGRCEHCITSAAALAPDALPPLKPNQLGLFR